MKKLLNFARLIAVLVMAVVTAWGGALYGFASHSTPPDRGGSALYERDNENFCRCAEISTNGYFIYESIDALRGFFGRTGDSRAFRYDVVQRKGVRSERCENVRFLYASLKQCCKSSYRYKCKYFGFNSELRFNPGFLHPALHSLIIKSNPQKILQRTSWMDRMGEVRTILRIGKEVRHV